MLKHRSPDGYSDAVCSGPQTGEGARGRPDPPKRHTRSRLSTWLPILAIAATGIVAYHNSLACPFLFDDEEAIVENHHIRSLRPLGRAVSAPPQSAVAGRPLVSLSLAVNYRLGGLNPWGYHTVNLAIHILAGLTLFGLVRRSLRSDRLLSRYGNAAAPLATAAAIFWVAHPLQTESVTYVVQRAESLMGLCYLSTLYCAVRGFQSCRPAAWNAAAVAVCAAGMVTKEVMATAPLLLLLYDRVFAAGSFCRAIRRRAGLYAALAATWVALGALVATGPRSASAGFGVEMLTPLDYALTQFGVILHYLKLTVWPGSLCLDYGWPPAQGVREILPPALVVAVVLAATLWALWYHPPLGFLGAWFFMVLAPSSSVMPIADLAFEHRMYLPLAAVCVLIVLVVHHGLARLGKTPVLPEGARRGVAGLLVVAVTTALVARTVRRNHDYRSAEAMWSDVVAKRPDNPRAHNNLGKALHAGGRLDRAIAQYRAALKLKPDYATAHNNLAAALAKQGDLAASIRHYRRALDLQPDWAEAHGNLGLALAGCNRLTDAVDCYRAALRLKPDAPETHYNLANALLRLRRIDEAEQHYNEALEYRPDYLEAHCNLAGVLMNRGKTDDARRHLAEALRIALRLGEELRAQGRIEDAAEVHRKAVRIDPVSAEAHYRLGCDLADLGRRAEAAEQFRQVLRIDPNHAAAKRDLDVTPPPGR